MHLQHLFKFTMNQNQSKPIKNQFYGSRVLSSENNIYHNIHLSFLFIGDPTGQLYALTKSSEFDRGPIIRNFPGE